MKKKIVKRLKKKERLNEQETFDVVNAVRRVWSVIYSDAQQLCEGNCRPIDAIELILDADRLKMYCGENYKFAVDKFYKLLDFQEQEKFMKKYKNDWY